MDSLNTKRQKICHSITPNYSILEEYHTVLYRLSNGHEKIVKILPNDLLKINKWNITLLSSQLVGLYYEQSYQIVHNIETSMHQLVPFKEEQSDCSDSENDELHDNRNLIQDNQSQTLTSNQIQEMKSQLFEGTLSPEQMIQTISGHSVTFHNKTEFSQIKYLKKKQKKFQRIIKFFPPSGHNLCQHYLMQKPEKILYMKQDISSQLLSCSDIHVGSDILLVDETCGLLAGSVLERTSISNSCNDNPDQLLTIYVPNGNLFIMDNFNFSQDQRDLCKVIKSISDLRNIKDNSMDVCIIASEIYHPLDLLKICQTKMKSSRQILIYNQYKEPLLSVFSYAMSNSFINVQLVESITRHYQVLPGRSHPHMTTSGRNGFILSMITILDNKE